MIEIRVNGEIYEAIVYGNKSDANWSGRESKSITLAMDYATAVATFADDVQWSILYQPTAYVDPETQETVTPEVEEYDNSDYCVAGTITDNRDGTVTVKMGKPTFEELYNILREAVEGESETAS